MNIMYKYINKYYALIKLRGGTHKQIKKIQIYNIAGDIVYSYEIVETEDPTQIVNKIIKYLLDNSNPTNGYFTIQQDKTPILYYSTKEKTGLYDVIDNYINNNDDNDNAKVLNLSIVKSTEPSISYLFFLVRYKTNDLLANKRQLIKIMKNY